MLTFLETVINNVTPGGTSGGTAGTSILRIGTSAGSYSGGTSASYPGLLRVGSTGTGVRNLQQALANRGYSLSADGVFGPVTQSAVKSFQSSQGITSDGIVGPVTWGKLF